MNITWEQFTVKASEWAATRPQGDNQATLLLQATQAADRLRDTKIKDIRTIICSVMGSDKPWEFLLGQTIASLPNPLPQVNSETSMISYIGIPTLNAMGFSVA